MRKSKGCESGGRWGVSLDLPHELINHVKVSHGKDEVDKTQVEHRAFHAATSRKNVNTNNYIYIQLDKHQPARDRMR